jgi:hypothetical protein
VLALARVSLRTALFPSSLEPPGSPVATPRPPPGTTIFTFGFAASRSSRLRGTSGRCQPAVERPIAAGSPDLSEGSFMWPQWDQCARAGRGTAVAYGRAVFVDVPTARSRNIESRGDCLVAREVFKPGPFPFTRLDGPGVEQRIHISRPQPRSASAPADERSAPRALR